MAINSVLQTIRNAEIDARSLSEFVSKDAYFTVTRRLAPTIHTLDYYLLVLSDVKEKGDLADIAISDTLDKLEQLEPTVIQRVEAAINNTAVEGGVLADTFVVVDGSLSQRTINKGLESIADLSTIKNPKNGLRVYVKSYHAGLGKGGDYFTFDSSKLAVNDGGLVINGWVREHNTVINPFLFGAKSDGITDDSQAVQAAFNAAENGCFVLPKSDGEFYIKSAVYPKSNCTILGMGGILKLGNYNANLHFLKAKNTKMIGVIINGNGDAWTGYDGYTVAINGCTDITIAYCHVYDGVNAGIAAGQHEKPDMNKGIKILHNRVERIGRPNHPNGFQAYGNGIAVTGGEDILIVGNTVSDIHQTGCINLEGQKLHKIVIADNICYNTTGRASGIKVYAGGLDVAGQDVVVRNNILYNIGDINDPDTEAAIWIQKGANVSVVGNTIRDCPSAGRGGQLYVQSDNISRVIDNTIYNCDGGAIRFNSALHGVVRNNTIICTANTPADLIPLFCESHSSGLGSLIVEGNTISDAPDAAIVFNPRSSASLINNNIINPNTKGGNYAVYSLTGLKNSRVGGNTFVISDVANFKAHSLYNFSGSGHADMVYTADNFKFDLAAFEAAGKKKWDMTSNNNFIQSDVPIVPKYVPVPTAGYNERGRVIRSTYSRVGDYSKYVCIESGTPGVWVGVDKITLDKLTSGDTSQRPTGVSTGFQFFDSTLEKPIYWSGSNWVDASGSAM